MKPKSHSFLPLISIVAITVVQFAGAAVGTWTGAVDNLWDASDINWSGVTGTPWDNANGPGNTAIFNTVNLAAEVLTPVYANAITFSLNGTIIESTINLAGTTPTISVATGQTGTISSNVAGTVGLVKSGAGLLALSNATYTGGTTVSGGRLALVNNETGSADFLTNAELEFNLTTGNQQISGGSITGSGKLIKTGGNELLLGADGSPQTISLASGALIDVQGGVIRNEYGNSAWGSNLADLNVATGATFDIWDGNTRVDAVSGTGTLRKGWYNANSITVGVDNGSGNFSGTINSAGGDPFSLIKEGTGTQTVSGSIGYNGGTTVSGGRLVLQNNKTGSSNFATNAELEFNLTTGDQQLINGTLSGTGSLIKTGTSNLILSDWSGNQTVAFTGTSSVIDVQAGTLSNFFAAGAFGPAVNWGSNQAGLTVASGATFDMINNSVTVDELNGAGTIKKNTFDTTGSLTVGVNNGSGTFTGTIENSNNALSVIKQGTGTQTLSGSIGYKGGTTVSGGRLVLENTKTGSSNYTTNAELEFNLTTADQQLISGTLSGTGKLVKTGANNLILSDWSGNYTVALTGANSVIDVQAGKLSNFFGAGAFGPDVNWASNEAGLTVASGATFELANKSVIVDELNGAGTINKEEFFNANTLTIGVKDGSGTFSGAITQTGSALSLVKQGSGTQTLTGVNTYNGATSVSAGTLALVGGSQASPITVSAVASLGFTLGSPTASTSSFDVTLGTIKITGTPTLASYTLISASSGITGTPVLHTAIPGYALAVDGNSLKLVQSGGSGYSSWAATNAPTGTSAQDFDGDGVANGAEYVLGGTKDTKDLGKLPQVSASGANMVVTFNRDQASINGTTTLAIQVGTNLATWPDSYNVPGPALANSPGVTVAKDTSPGFDTITLTIPRSPDATKFARLNVTTN